MYFRLLVVLGPLFGGPTPTEDRRKNKKTLEQGDDIEFCRGGLATAELGRRKTKSSNGRDSFEERSVRSPKHGSEAP